MKKSIYLILSILICAVGFAQDNHLYTAKSGKIVYEYELDDVISSYALIFDNYGKKQAIDIKSVDGEHVKTIITNEFMYVVNYDDKQVMKIPTNMEGADMAGGSGAIDFSGLVSELSGSSQYKSGTAIVAGKNCDVYNYNDGMGNKGKYWIWKGYLLKADFIGEEGERAFMQVKEINIDQPVSPTEFEYPSNFEINDMSKMMEQMQQLQQLYGVPDGN